MDAKVPFATEYAQQWQSFNRLRRNMIILAPGGLLLVLAGLSLQVFVKPVWPLFAVNTTMMLVLPLIVWITRVVALDGRILAWPCPKCGEAFSGGKDAQSARRSLLPKQCASCGLAAPAKF